MSTRTTVVPLLVFEAADCLMAVLAAEVSHLDGPGGGREGSPAFDLDESVLPLGAELLARLALMP